MDTSSTWHDAVKQEWTQADTVKQDRMQAEQQAQRLAALQMQLQEAEEDFAAADAAVAAVSQAGLTSNSGALVGHVRLRPDMQLLRTPKQAMICKRLLLCAKHCAQRSMSKAKARQ